VTELAPADLEHYRRDLTGYCYRMLGSSHDAEDAVQDTLARAWRALDTFEDRAGLRPWLYRIATNVCLDHLKGRKRRALPVDLESTGATLEHDVWVEPAADRVVLAADGDPAETVVARESVRIAFVAALQHLAPKQRAVLILRDVLKWRANEVADFLDTSTDAVNSMLRRARTALADVRPTSSSGSAVDLELLDRYVDAFERFDLDALATLLHHDAILEMPPIDLCVAGVTEICRWLAESDACRGAVFETVALNGSPAVALYQQGAPKAVQVLDVDGDRITAIHVFLDISLFPVLGLPPAPALAHC